MPVDRAADWIADRGTTVPASADDRTTKVPAAASGWRRLREECDPRRNGCAAIGVGLRLMFEGRDARLRSIAHVAPRGRVRIERAGHRSLDRRRSVERHRSTRCSLWTHLVRAGTRSTLDRLPSPIRWPSITVISLKSCISGICHEFRDTGVGHRGDTIPDTIFICISST